MSAEQAAPAPTGLSAELNFVPVFNLALQQNALPVVYELKLNNHTGRDLHRLTCEFGSTPDLILPKTIPVEELKDGEELPLHDLGIELDYSFLADLSEAVNGKLSVTVREGDKVLTECCGEVRAFAVDQWLGLQVLPELLAAFVTPNMDVIAELQTVVADELKKATGSPDIEGYQADRKRVYEICAAVYRAIRSWGIRYANPPSSFGEPGQRIRFADTIRQHRVGTCLDTTLLFASLMERCNLHPVILLHTGHAYIGCHLADRYFPDIPMDDLQTIRKLADLDEFLVLETTLVSREATFSVAEAAARTEHLNIDSDFQCAIDVVRARYSGIHPLPLKRSVNGIEISPVRCDAAAPQEREELRRLEAGVDLAKLGDDGARGSRVARWTQKLLDLSLRNRLLNVRDTKQIIPIACPDISILEDRLAADRELSLNALPDLLGEKDLHDMAMLRNSEVRTEIKALLEKELSQCRLWTLLPQQEMNRRMIGLYRQSRTDQEEGGVNTLFLSVGFLEWKQSERDARSYLAPILLVPVRMQRKSILEGIRISRIDEDTVINETLLELLRSQFHLTVPGLSPLPTDDSGVDVRQVMQIFRQVLKDMKGWEVREEACIGHFSFGKFIMWTDMTARVDDLRQNPLVDHLVGGGGLFDDHIEVFPPEKIAEHLDPAELYCPLSADSSQLAAVLYSAMGKSFVLHGPPGTGKSQTITNIIAHNLALGRRVLFVSEKKAALDVVHRRLSSVGLKPFCLELHSSKSGKTEVLQQFAEALQVPETPSPAEWDSTVRTLEKLRGELNEYVRELHRKFPNGFSAYDCLSRLMPEIGADEPDLPLEIDFLKQSAEEYETARHLAYELAAGYRDTSPEALAALDRLAPLEWSPVMENDLRQAARKLSEASAELQKHFAAVAPQLGLPADGGAEMIFHAALLAEELKQCGDLPAGLFDPAFPKRAAFLRKFAENELRFAALAEKLRPYRSERLRELDFAGIAERIRRNSQVFFVLRFFRTRALLRELADVKKTGGVPLTLPELQTLLPDAEAYAEAAAAREKGQAQASELLGKFWNDGEPKWDALSPMLETAQKILDLALAAAGDDEARRNAVLESLRQLLPDASRRYRKGAEARTRINGLLAAWNAFQETREQFSRFALKTAQTDDLRALDAELAGILDRLGSLRGVLRYRGLRRAAKACGLGKFSEAMEKRVLPPEELPRLFERRFCRTMLNQILEISPTLCRFNGGSQNERIREFRELDRKYTGLTRKIVFARLAANLPRRRSGPCPEGTELGLLKRECEKRARQKPVRQLLEQIPTLAPLLKPCFLMSPLSVAQYLPSDTAQFDLIVFDEASQIPVWDAIGVIARGRQLIVVGDPKQMPPTDFFQKKESEDDEPLPEETEDMESILDECIAAGVHSTYLNWHYRSRHESLISFSNHFYYDDRLFTFPAARDSEKLGVRFEFVDGGVYDRSGSRTNRREAEALTAYVFRQLERAGDGRRSVGVVTFSQAQKDLIEDLIERERAAHPELESYFSDRNEEPLFVKNLENVQGDERDVILFSVGYAPDADGKFSMNFGPLNRQGGERRLNVAITRAKEQVVVFSSIHAHQIDLKRTNATGAAHLKFFLDYAEKKVRPRSAAACGEAAGDGLAEVIARFLAGHGFAVERSIGCSDCRIDLAVRDPRRADGFLLGIECDGEAYAAQKTARDRENLRSGVLQTLGWCLYRAWSVDWAFDRARAEAGLLALLEELQREAPETPPADDAPSEPAPAEEEPPPESSAAAAAGSQNRRTYTRWTETAPLRQDVFFLPEGRKTILRQIGEILRQEGPICEKLLKKRIVRAWGFARTGENILQILNACLPAKHSVTQLGEDRVFWPEGVRPADFSVYRVAEDAESKRQIDEIPPEEIANAMYEVLMDFNACEQDTLYRETVRLLGFSAVTSKARKYLEVAMSALRSSGRVQ